MCVRDYVKQTGPRRRRRSRKRPTIKEKELEGTVKEGTGNEGDAVQVWGRTQVTGRGYRSNTGVERKSG